MDEDSDEGTDSEEESPGAETAGTLGSRKRARYMSRIAVDCPSSPVGSYSLHILTTRRWGGCVYTHNLFMRKKRDFMWF